jgi:hypothetical protein
MYLAYYNKFSGVIYIVISFILLGWKYRYQYIFELLNYLYVIDLISHVTLSIKILQISKANDVEWKRLVSFNKMKESISQNGNTIWMF